MVIEQAIRRTSLSSLLGRSVLGHDGNSLGRIAELVVSTEGSGTHITGVLLTPSGRLRAGSVQLLPLHHIHFEAAGGMRLRDDAPTPEAVDVPDTSVLLERDLLDQQIIDVHGHKVVRVNDVDLVWETETDDHRLRIAEVEVGMRGAVRRLLKGLPHTAVEAMAHRFQPRVIPWEFVDLIDRDPARRVRLKIEGDRLSSMHPSDIADILEELAPAEREAVFGSLDEEIAAEALEEVDPKLQRSLLEGMESSRVADIVEEMDPGAAADLLAELPEERSEEILHQMEPAERAEVEELLEFPEDWAAGLMTSEYVAVPDDSNVQRAIEALRNFEGDVDTVNEVFLLDAEGRLRGAVTLATLALSNGETKLLDVKEAHLHTCSIDAGSRAIAEQFDKYNLRSLAVLEHDGQLAGVIYPEHVIALLRAGH
jgi:flagellar motility protein MotE (MotC chaperone)/sporulation protein YlmC with PRC-barrel domain